MTGAQEDPGAVGLVDWARTGRRVRTSALVLGGGALGGWLLTGLLGDGLTAGALGGWIGLAFGLGFVVELVVVGGAAVRGMLRAGARGERLASDGVGLLPTSLKHAPWRTAASDDGDEGQSSRSTPP